MNEILSLLEITFNAGLISEMNLRVIGEEYRTVLKLVKEKEGAFLNFTNEYFRKVDNSEIKIPDDPKSTNPEKAQPVHKGHIKDNKMSFIKRLTNAGAPSLGAGKLKDSDRRNLIVNLVKSRGEIDIHDAISVIKGVSEKTIQRELIALSKEGILVKKGERRWSRYTLPRK